jgi:hypothetical protein
VGTHALKAVLRSGAFPASTSAVVTVTVSPGTVTPAPTTVAVGSSLNPAVVGQAVTFTATVRGPAGSGAPTGTVVFTDGNVTLGRGEVQADGTATFTTSFAVAGGHVITAVYNGDPNFLSSSRSLTEQVRKATTSTLSASANPARVKQAVTFTATVGDPTGTGTPTGTVTFFVGNTVVATVTLDANGQASFTRVFSHKGLFSIRAVYSGDANFDASSQSLTEQVG